MKQADISQQLGSLIGKTQGIYTTVDADESIPSELQEPDPIFEINYNDLQSVSNGEAYETVTFIVKSVVPQAYQTNEMILNKMKLDAYQLGNLYYQQKINNTAIQTAMDVIAKGDTQPRMFDIIDKLQKRAGDLTDQIIELQNQFRKYYIDTYLDMKSKEDIDFEDAAPKKRPKLEKPTSPKQIEQVEQNSIEPIVHNDAEHILSSSSDIIDDIQARRLQRIKAKNAEFSEVEN
jgi:hypothetical protein